MLTQKEGVMATGTSKERHPSRRDPSTIRYKDGQTKTLHPPSLHGTIEVREYLHSSQQLKVKQVQKRTIHLFSLQKVRTMYYLTLDFQIEQNNSVEIIMYKYMLFDMYKHTFTYVFLK